ncbi:beta-galactosidase [Natranaeroarchaeum aerophilus]|uniref:beta-galactosidase n=1 Tax=Natranaeroarchaeum aerophilus TaxID=2917711 RepID=A0AAE3K7U4_9EURY|nr:beta-galactosidase [Natranaeroarchaeum aerophilus]MCL9814289.1 beta-galactosidase [Natranaeroarchaeum aerophilus]
MSIGVCYFPEHWPSERWEQDVEEMVEAGIEYVRMSEFAWAQLEPERDEFDFEWLDTVVDHLHEQDIDVVLCTPTATPPRWLVDDHPDILQEEDDGTKREFGSRRHYCFNSESYRLETARIVDELGEHFADHPGVVGWQIDNEFGCHGTLRCYCNDCSAAFSEWLEDRHGDIEALNDNWGTDFWSQQYDRFEQIQPPRHTAAWHHPSLLLDYARFTSDSVVEFNALQADLLNDHNDDWFITHNFMDHYPELDSYDVCESLDFASWDSYPTGFAQERGDPSTDELLVGDLDWVSFNHDLYRSAADAPFWVMEQQPGDINWPPYSPQPAEGAVRLWAHHAMSHGAESVVYFRWRRCREGQEQYHAGLLDADGSKARGYEGASEAASELVGLPDPGEVSSSVAVLHEYDNLWAVDEQANTPDFEYWEHLHGYYAVLRRRGVSVDVVEPTAALDEYDAVVAPTLYLINEERADALESYVEDGGELLLTLRSGVKDRHNKLLNASAPGPLADLVGTTVDEHEAQHPKQEQVVEYRGETYGYHTWNERLSPDSATVVGTYAAGSPDGLAAITEHEFGAGSAVYCGLWPDEDLTDRLVDDLLDRAGVEALSEPLPDNVRVTERGGKTWVTNGTGESVEIDASADAEFLLGEATVPAYDLSIADGPVTGLDVKVDESQS